MFKRLFFATLLALAVLVLPGCYTVSAGPEVGTVGFVMGDLQAERAENLQDVHQATVQTLEDMDIRIIEEEQDAIQSRIIARDQDDRRIRIQLERTPEDYTSVSVRVGALGDEQYSTEIYSEIVGRLRGEVDNGVDDNDVDDNDTTWDNNAADNQQRNTN